ncbi:predicted protein [Botrytis cinerea T4]|uniref:Uncharacterized protein n=1 Tax=Botryotinia fuckeliana (strain T4) TaxID=999810 RepID=G2YTT0_BOTF4|nr:predicted protein [Botrytis cinerea T4]
MSLKKVIFLVDLESVAKNNSDVKGIYGASDNFTFTLCSLPDRKAEKIK